VLALFDSLSKKSWLSAHQAKPPTASVGQMIVCSDVFDNSVKGGLRMYTSLVLVALSGSLIVSSPSESLAWQTDYSQAKKMGQSEKKPLAVFVGSGANGYDKVSREGQLSPEVQKSLENYVYIYLDSSTPAGQKLAADFGITQSTGLVLSDRSGELQAFSHDGDLGSADMQRWVAQYADPNVVVNTTMTNNNARLSMYPSNGAAASYIYGAGTGYVGGSIIYGGGCPGGNCSGVRIIR